MAYIEFGHTWWGKRWLQALSSIDFSNRLPRGKRYARNGSVKSIDIQGPTVTARVKGRRPSPYKISLKLWSFKKADKNTILEIIRNNPYYLSQLAARELPQELEEEVLQKGIRIFPRSWKDLGMRCSCPDWAVPCKHLAAVVYIIANEIDKNPFLVFRMHGLDLTESLHGTAKGSTKGASEHAVKDTTESAVQNAGRETIPAIESVLADQRQEYTYHLEQIEGIDLSTITDMHQAVSQLLTDFPLFYPAKDFKQLLLKAYSRASKAAQRYVKDLDLQEEPPATLYNSCSIALYKGKNQYAGKLQKGDRKIQFDSEDFSPLIEYLKPLSAGNLSVYPPLLAYLIMINNYALKLLECNAAVPEIISRNQGSYIIRWVPALFNREVSHVFELLVENLPEQVLIFDRAAINHTGLDRRQQVLFLISFFIGYYLCEFEARKGAPEDPIIKLFFEGRAYTPKRFEEQENAQTINLWLGRFFVRPINYRPVVHIEETPDTHFHFEIRIKDRRNEEELPILFSDFMKKPESEIMPLLRDLSLLATYLNTVHAFLKNSGPIILTGDEFIEQWFAALPVLRTLGVHTVVPKALRSVFYPQLSLKMSAPPGSADSVVSYTSLKDMLEFQWQIAAGDSFIDPEELFELKARYGSFVRYKDMFLELDEKQLAALSRKMEKPPALSPMELLKTGLTGTLGGTAIETNEEVEKLFASLLSPPEKDAPERLQAELRPYQLRGFQWLYHNHHIGLGSVVADDMGLGKTVQVIALLLQLKNEKVVSRKKPVLIIVPASLVTNWQRELQRFAPDLEPAIYHGQERTIPEEAELLITTYALARRDAELLKKKRWALAIVDEAQNIKNTATAQTKAVKSIKGDHRIAMTGTPVENRLLDYWSIIDYVMKGYLPGRKAFKENFAIPIERYRNHSVVEHFRRLTSPLILRRLKTDTTIIKDLPEKIVTNRFPPLTKEQSVMYQELVEYSEQMLADQEGIKRSGMVFKLMTGLKQICCHPYLYARQGETGCEASGKAAALIELLQTIHARGEKALIFTQFAEMGKLLKKIIEQQLHTPCLFFYGGSSRKVREALVDTFQNSHDHPFMVLSIKAGGVGLNLTAANHVVHYDLWWNPAVENQATDRAFRIGQRKDVTVYRLITRGTFEEKINAMLEAKEELSNLTVSQGEQWLTKMDTAQLKELIQLSEE